MSDGENDKPQLPTIRERLSEWFGVQLPGLPAMPQTLKNLDKAIGNIVLSLGDNAKARIDGNTAKAKEGGKIEVDDLVRNAEERRKLENRAAIAHIAIDDVKSNPGDSDTPNEIEEDWLNTFSRIAEDKNSEDLRRLFGRILAGEIRSPGSFSLRTLQFVSSISKSEAESISIFFSYAFLPGYVPILDNGPGPNLKDRVMMQELGLASHAHTLGGLSWSGIAEPGKRFSLLGYRFGVSIHNRTPANIRIEIPCQVLSQPAKDLLAIANAPAMSIDFLRALGLEIMKKLDSEYRDHVRSNRLEVSLVWFNKPAGEWRILEELTLPEDVLQ